MFGLLGKKVGMTRFFDETGASVSATLVEVGPCAVVQVKTAEKDGYNAVQLVFINAKKNRTNKPLMGHFQKAKVEPKRVLKEFRDFNVDVKVGDELRVDQFTEGERVKITGCSKGRGFAGVMKWLGFHGGPKSHGQSDRARAPGSIGQSAYPKRVFKGISMGGRMGNERNTIKNLKVLKVLADRNMLLVEGGIPGSRNSLIEIKRYL